ncbi:hypothetical protein ACE1CD_23770 [Aerosakkonema sp. BLCC-F183]|uniref:hypothetical protein n=1 Tax=Aerosakkonema sp. BLCC-F183 TaxID=3342834 RepID=UPI0035B702A0
MTQNPSLLKESALACQVTQPNPLELLAKLVEHPKGVELANTIYQLHKDVQGNTQPNLQLVAIALNKAKSLGIENIPYFKGMSNSEIRTWLEQNS